MAPNLAQSQRSLISDMLRSKSFKAHEIAQAAECSVRSVYAIKSNIRLYGSTKSPPNGGGRPRNVTPVMGDALREYLLENPDTYQDEMVLFLLDEFGGPPLSIQSIKGWLKSIGWTQKKDTSYSYGTKR
jgi:transposase